MVSDNEPRHLVKPSPAGVFAIGAAIVVIGVGIGLAVAGKPDADSFGPYAPALMPIWLVVIGASALASGIVLCRPTRLSPHLPALSRIALVLRAVAFAIWGVIAVGFVFG